MPKPDYRYIQNEKHFFNEVLAVWGRHVPQEAVLRRLFENLSSVEEKNLFLRVGAFYRYLVREGRFHFERDDLNNSMSFIDDTYKFIAIFALVEALEVANEHKDFYQWLEKETLVSEIDPNLGLIRTLEPLYAKYKTEYGSRQAAVHFFSRLDDQDQQFIQSRLQLRGKTPSVQKLARILYDMRSKFVHEAQFVLGFGHLPSIVSHDKDIITNKMTISDLCTLFERGFLKRFGWTGSTRQPDRTRLR
jgi:hypothetical protein